MRSSFPDRVSMEIAYPILDSVNSAGGTRSKVMYTRGGMVDTHGRGRIYSSSTTDWFAIDDGSGDHPQQSYGLASCIGSSFQGYCNSAIAEITRLQSSGNYMNSVQWNGDYYDLVDAFALQGTPGTFAPIRSGTSSVMPGDVVGPDGRKGGYLVFADTTHYVERKFYRKRTTPPVSMPSNVTVSRSEFCFVPQNQAPGEPRLICRFPMTTVRFYYCNLGFQPSGTYFEGPPNEPNGHPLPFQQALPCIPVSNAGPGQEKAFEKGGTRSAGSGDEPKGPDDDCQGNPCIPGKGEKLIVERDFEFAGHIFTRTYRSSRSTKGYGYIDDNWHHSWSSRLLTPKLAPNASASFKFVQGGDGEIETFAPVSTDHFRSTHNESRLLRKIQSSPERWRLTTSGGAYQDFDQDGRLIELGSLSDPSRRLTFSYMVASSSLDLAWWALERATDARGRVLKFEYNLDKTYQPRLLSIKLESDPAMPEVMSFTYWDENVTSNVFWRLKQVRYADNRVRRYLYGDHEPANGNGLRNHVTGVLLGTVATIDSIPQRFATYRYDANGRVIDSFQGGALNAGRVQLNYVGNSDTAPSSVEVTQPLGDVRTFQMPPLGVNAELNALHFANSVVDGSGTAARVYNAQSPSTCGNAAANDWRLCRSTDRRGFVTQYFYTGAFQTLIWEGLQNSAGNPATTSTRAIGTAWDASLGLPTERAVCAGKVQCAGPPSNAWPPSLQSVERWVYDSSGKVLASCEYDPSVSNALNYACGSANDAPVGVRQTRRTYCTIGAPGCTAATVGWLRQIDGPRVGVADITTYAYHTFTTTQENCATNGPCHREGDLASITNALGHVRSFPRYDFRGRNTRSVDPNGTITDLVYDTEGRLTQRIVRAPSNDPNAVDATMRMEYEFYGEVKRILQPDGIGIEYCRDAAHRITALVQTTLTTSSQCNGATPLTGNDAIVYTLDAAGNRIKEEMRDTTGSVKRLLARQYNALGQLRSTINAPYASASNLDDPSVKKTTYTYDQNSNVDLTTDPLGRISDNDYDPLNRLIQSIQDKDTAATTGEINATVGYEYDARDNLRKVIDPKNLHTSYAFDGLNNQTQLNSPDTGVSNFTFDAAGNRLTQTDARGVLSNYSYDAANRLIAITYPSEPTQNVAFFYDTLQSVCATGEQVVIGQMTRMTDETGQTQFCYDHRGNLRRKVQTTYNTVLTTVYSYNVADRLIGMTYPSGIAVAYVRDSQGRVVSATASRGSFSLPLVTSASYQPFGPIKQLNFGNGETLNKVWDQNYWPDAVTSAAINYDFTTNDVGNITVVSADTLTQGLSYDGLDRLLQVVDPSVGWQVEQFTYDTTGNRLTRSYRPSPSAPTITHDYTYEANSHRIDEIDGKDGKRTYDANGNTLTGHLGAEVALYSARNRLQTFVSEPALGGYSPERYWRYNARGERVATQAANVITIGSPYEFFVYDQSGQIACIVYPEWGQQGSGADKTTGEPTRFEEVVWFDDVPVARIFSSTLAVTSVHAIHSDHLNTPRALSNLQAQGGQAAGTVVWRWRINQQPGTGSNAFGSQRPDQDPDGNGTLVGFRLRFPGQLHDEASGLHYNYFRDYEPGTGRYVESDPIGLRGGFSTFTYVESGPYAGADHFGLECKKYYLEGSWSATGRYSNRKGFRDIVAMCAPSGGEAGYGPNGPGFTMVISCWMLRFNYNMTYQDYERIASGIMICRDNCGKETRDYLPQQVLETQSRFEGEEYDSFEWVYIGDDRASGREDHPPFLPPPPRRRSPGF